MQLENLDIYYLEDAILKDANNSISQLGYLRARDDRTLPTMKHVIVVQRLPNARHTIRCPTMKSLILAPNPTNHCEIFRGSASTPSSYPSAGMPLRVNDDKPLGITASVIRPLRDDWFFFIALGQIEKLHLAAAASAISEPISAHPTDHPIRVKRTSFMRAYEKVAVGSGVYRPNKSSLISAVLAPHHNGYTFQVNYAKRPRPPDLFSPMKRKSSLILALFSSL